MESIAIIGSGISGMSCGYFLNKNFNITVYEQNDYIGGHTNTVTVNDGIDQTFIDTGFMVFNKITFPNITRLFDELGVNVQKAEMTFSMQDNTSKIIYNNISLNGLFAARANIFSIRFLKMVRDIYRFKREVSKLNNDANLDNQTFLEYLKNRGYGEDFLFKYLIPISAAIWSTPIEVLTEFPAISVIRFFSNKGTDSDVLDHWYSIVEGSESYKKILIKDFKEKIKKNTTVVKVERENGAVKITTSNGEVNYHDKVIFACHADQALKLIVSPDENQKNLLSKFKYNNNHLILHTDESLMPEKKKVWAAWNYRMDMQAKRVYAFTTYYMNKILLLENKKDYFLSVNPPGNIDSKKIINEFDYFHPAFSIETIKAQKHLHKLNENGQIYFCGSYFKYGFHEDALCSALNVCEKIMGGDPWIARKKNVSTSTINF